MLSIAELQKKYNNAQLLLILITRLYFKKNTQAETQQFISTNAIDWQLFYQLTAAHHIRAFIYNVIVAEKLVINTDVKAKLKSHTLTANLNNLHQLKMLTYLEAEFKSLGVSVIPYKGVGFAARYFPSTSYRESSDLDFLVPENAVPVLRSYFHTKGYLPKEDVPAPYLPYIISTIKELSFKTPVDALGINCSVEIQWKLVENFVGKFPAYDFFAPHMQQHAKAKVTGLAPTYDFICLASHHLIREPLIRFKYLIDMAALLTQAGKEVDLLLADQLFKQYGYHRFFTSAMQVLQQLLGVGQSETNKRNKEDVEVLLHQVLSYPVVDKVELSDTESLGLLFRFQPGYISKIKLAARIAFATILPGIADIQHYKMPYYSFPLLFILRPYRLLKAKMKGTKKTQAHTAVG